MMRLLLLLSGFILAGCAPSPRNVTLFDLTPQVTAQALPFPILLEPFYSIPAYMGTDLLYRLDYAGGQLRPYSSSRWNSPPDSQFALALNRAGGDNLLTLEQSPHRARCALRIGLVRFEQVFTDTHSSHAELAVNLALVQLNNRRELKRDSLHLEVPAETADARGGAQALETASRQAATKIIEWLNSLLAPAGSGTNPVRTACER